MAAALLQTVAVLLALVVPVAAAAQDRPAEHPLAGRIWDVRGERFVSEDELIAALQGARYVLLGKSHDNAEHHRLQARVVERLARTGRKPFVAFEQMDAGQQAALDAHLAAGGDAAALAAGLGRAVRWSNAWPEWRFYQPIAEAALAAGLRLVAANVSDELLRRAMRDRASLDAAFVARTRLDTPLPDTERRTLERELVAMHCGTTGPVIEMMITAQRVRDAAFADALVTRDEGARTGVAGTGGAGDGAVLIAGTGHARSDRGVPWVLRLMRPAAPVASVGMLETAAALTRPADYAAAFGAPEARTPFDYLWFTSGGGSGRDVDPCR